jgi:hypothetical protein
VLLAVAGEVPLIGLGFHGFSSSYIREKRICTVRRGVPAFWFTQTSKNGDSVLPAAYSA